MASFYENIYPKWNKERFNQMQKLLDLNPNKKIHRFSKGMQRQVAFWLALCAMPDYLILDEPFDGLDPVIRKKNKIMDDPGCSRKTNDGYGFLSQLKGSRGYM